MITVRDAYYDKLYLTHGAIAQAWFRALKYPKRPSLSGHLKEDLLILLGRMLGPGENIQLIHEDYELVVGRWRAQDDDYGDTVTYYIENMKNQPLFVMVYYLRDGHMSFVEYQPGRWETRFNEWANEIIENRIPPTEA